jgi:ribosomal protein S18 acetylase RimI-like enzyme
MNQITYRLASKADNDQLIRLTSESGMGGETGLRIDRYPDFFRLLEMRGETKVFLALDGLKIIGCLCATPQHVYVGGKVFPLQYIGDFKIEKSYRNRGIGLRLCDEMASYVISIGSDLAFLNVSMGNTKPLSFFRNRPNVPDFDNIGIFHSYQFVGKKRRSSDPDYRVEPATATVEILNFLNEHQRNYELGAVVTEKSLEGVEVFVVCRDEKIIAAMCLADTMHVKQNVVTKISWKMKTLLTLVNALRGITGFSKMPGINNPVQMMYIKYLSIINNDKRISKILLNYARNLAYDKSYSFISVGLHEKDPLKACFSGLFKLTFNSVGMLLSIKNNRELVRKVREGVPFEDFSLV